MPTWGSLGPETKPSTQDTPSSRGSGGNRVRAQYPASLRTHCPWDRPHRAFLHQSLPTSPPSWSLIHPLLHTNCYSLLLPSLSSSTWTRATAFWQSFLLWHPTVSPTPKTTLHSAQDPSVAHGLQAPSQASQKAQAPCRSAAAASTLNFPPLSSNCLQVLLTLHTGSPSPGLC